MKMASAIQLPNLIIAGAPKCGTSSLFNWLAAHPQIQGSSPKETFYFVDTDNPLFRSEANYSLHNLDRYKFFPQAKQTSQPQFYLEATTHYLYQESALNFFTSCQPQPHVVFILRRPSDRIFSSFNYTQNNLARLDKSVSFTQFVELLLSGEVYKIKNKFYSKNSFFVLNNDLLYSQYHKFLEPWSKRLAPEKIHVLLFEQIRSDPQKAVCHLCHRLGISSDFYYQFGFQSRNRTLLVKNPFIHRNLRKFSPLFQNGGVKNSLKSLYFKSQYQPTNLVSPNAETLRQLDGYFTPHNQNIAHDFDLDLSCWQSSFD